MSWQLPVTHLGPLWLLSHLTDKDLSWVFSNLKSPLRAWHSALVMLRPVQRIHFVGRQNSCVFIFWVDWLCNPSSRQFLSTHLAKIILSQVCLLPVALFPFPYMGFPSHQDHSFISSSVCNSFYSFKQLWEPGTTRTSTTAVLLPWQQLIFMGLLIINPIGAPPAKIPPFPGIPAGKQNGINLYF